MRRATGWLLALLAAAPGTGAQTAVARPPLEQRLDPQLLAELQPVFAAARRDSLPVRALEDKALEGAAKRVPPERIVAAVRRLADDLRLGRTALRQGAPALPLDDEDVVAAADAHRRGVPASEIVALRARAPAAASLLVALTVLGDLVQRGVPADRARAALVELLEAGVTTQQIIEIPARVDAALRVGAPPVEALNSALPQQLRPVTPPTRPPRPAGPQAGATAAP